MKQLVIFFLILFSAPTVLTAQDKTGALSGRVFDRDTLEPLIGASVMIQNSTSGSAANADGEYTIQNLPSGIYTVVVRYIGYETQRLTDVVVGSNRTTVLNVKLSPYVLDGQEVTVTSGYFRTTDADAISTISFSPEEIRRSPGAAQELARVLMSTPGVASRGDTSQDLIVRGGSPMENGYYIDNIPIPGVRHFENQGGTSNGPIGIVNTELIQNIDFSTGGFSVAYGNHLSSISTIDYREGARERIRGDVGANLAGFNANLEGPLADRRGSYLLSVRRSYLDLIASAINTGGAPSYGDLQAKVVRDLDKSNKLIFLNIYGSSLFESSLTEARDEGVADAVRSRNRQNTSGLNWRRLRKNGYSNTSASFSFSAEDQLARDVLTETAGFDFENSTSQVAIRNVNYQRLSDRTGIEFGADLSYESATYDYFIAEETNRSGFVRPEFIRENSVDGLLGSVFVSLSTRLAPRLTTTVGTRTGINSYNQELNVDVNLKSRYQPTSRLGINAAFGRYHQSLPGYILSQNRSFEELSDTRVHHYVAGVDYLLSSDTKISFEGFIKEYRNAPILPGQNSVGNPGFVLDNAGVFYSELNDNGTASARGVEMMIQKKLAVNLYGMMSASYFRSTYEDFNGEVRSRDYDNRYLLSLIGGYRPNDKWEVSARWTLMGGRPTTPIDEAASADAGTEVLRIDRLNDERLPAYHSLYLRADRRFFFNRTNMVTFIEFWNAYNNANVDSYFWNQFDGRVDEATQFSFLPVLGIKFEF